MGLPNLVTYSYVTRNVHDAESHSSDYTGEFLMEFPQDSVTQLLLSCKCPVSWKAQFSGEDSVFQAK